MTLFKLNKILICKANCLIFIQSTFKLLSFFIESTLKVGFKSAKGFQPQ